MFYRMVSSILYSLSSNYLTEKLRLLVQKAKNNKRI